MDSSPPPDQSSPLGFEEAIKRLTEIVDRLEHGDLPLEQSLALFEQGMRLARASQAELDRAEKRVEEILSLSPDGTPITRDLGERT